MSAAIEILRGQLLIGSSPEDTRIFSTLHRLSKVAIANRYPMLFRQFTGLTRTVFLSKRRHLIEDAKRIERLEKRIDQFREWEKTRRVRWKNARHKAEAEANRRNETWV